MLDSLMLSASQRSLLEEMTAQCEKNVDQLADFLDARGIGREEAVRFRLGYASDGQYAGRMMIPYLTPGGVVGFRFRDIGGQSSAKYLGAEGASTRLFNTGAIVRGGEVVAVCEGELDAVVCDSFVVPAVGTTGTQWKPHWSRCFADFERVLVVCDNDEKEDGSNPGLKHGKTLLTKVPRSELVIPPAGMDLNEWYLAEGPDAIREAMKLT